METEEQLMGTINLTFSKIKKIHCAKNKVFPLRISSVNVTSPQFPLYMVTFIEKTLNGKFFVQWLSPQYIQNCNQLSSVRATIPLIYGVFGQEMTRRYDKMFQFSSMEEFTCALFKDFEQTYCTILSRYITTIDLETQHNFYDSTFR